MKIVHAADLHIDSPLRGLDRYEGAPVEAIRGATRRATENLVGLCIEEQASLLLLAGDIYDGSWRDYKTGLFFAAQMARLRAAGISVVMVRGNHDAQSSITRALRLPENVHEMSTKRPESRVYEDLGVVVHGQSFATRAVPDDLAAGFPERREGLINFGLLHTSASGRPGHETYAPCSVETLQSKGYDYWALGHVHTREVLEAAPWIVFPGNLQGRNVHEPGAKGATLIAIEGSAIAEVKHVPLDVVRFALCTIDATEAENGHDVVDQARAALTAAVAEAAGRTVAARLVITGQSRAHDALASDPEKWTAELRAASIDACGDDLWLEGVRFRTQTRLDLEAIRERDDAIGKLARSLHDLAQGGEGLASLREGLSDLKSKLPHELRLGPDGIDLEDEETLRSALADVEQTLLVRLLSEQPSGERGA